MSRETLGRPEIKNPTVKLCNVEHHHEIQINFVVDVPSNDSICNSFLRRHFEKRPGRLFYMYVVKYCSYFMFQLFHKDIQIMLLQMERLSQIILNVITLYGVHLDCL